MHTAFAKGVSSVVEFGGGIGQGETPADKRPNLESMIKKALKAEGREAEYLGAINVAGIRAAAEQLG
jgi:[acyl-carrier-protein] S-malonyltransferase